MVGDVERKVEVAHDNQWVGESRRVEGWGEEM